MPTSPHRRLPRSAQQKRERNAKAGGPKEAKSQLKSNEAAKNVVCQTCRQTFLLTVREPAYVHQPGTFAQLTPQTQAARGEQAQQGTLRRAARLADQTQTVKDCFPTWSATA